MIVAAVLLVIPAIGSASEWVEHAQSEVDSLVMEYLENPPTEYEVSRSDIFVKRGTVPEGNMYSPVVQYTYSQGVTFSSIIVDDDRGPIFFWVGVASPQATVHVNTMAARAGCAYEEYVEPNTHLFVVDCRK